MTTVHEQFLQLINQGQQTELAPNFSRLVQLQADLASEMSRLDEELTGARPDSFRVSTNVYRIGKTINKWRSEHKKMGKKLGIAK